MQCKKIKRTCTTFCTQIFQRHKVTYHLRPQKFLVFLHMKCLNKLSKRELEDSSSEYEIAVGRNSRDRQSNAVCEIISDVTPPNPFFGQEWRQTKNAFMLGRIKRIPDSCHEAVRVTRTLRAIARSARRPRSGCPRPWRSAPGQMVGPPAFPRSPLVYFVRGVRGQL